MKSPKNTYLWVNDPLKQPFTVDLSFNCIFIQKNYYYKKTYAYTFNIFKNLLLDPIHKCEFYSWNFTKNVTYFSLLNLWKIIYWKFPTSVTKKNPIHKKSPTTKQSSQVVMEKCKVIIPNQLCMYLHSLQYLYTILVTEETVISLLALLNVKHFLWG